MTLKRKKEIIALLKGIETGDESSIAVINPNRYIQHNPQTQEGGEGLAALFKRLSKSSPRVNIVRIFSDGDYVFGHTEYDFSTSRIGFEIFRFEGDQAVEHWDNIQPREGPNLSGHTMVDGETTVIDLQRTEENRHVVRNFVDEVLIGRQLQTLSQFVSVESYTEHDPHLADDVASLRAVLTERPHSQGCVIRYEKRHKLLAEGNFVLTACEGLREGVPTSLFDLYRLAKGVIVEHWGTVETIPARSEWKNENGKF